MQIDHSFHHHYPIDCYDHGNTVHRGDASRVETRTAHCDDVKAHDEAHPYLPTKQQQQQQAATRRHAAPKNNGWDDQHYDYMATKGEVLASRYKIQKFIGGGSFGQVWQAHDCHACRDVAIKIIKSKRSFFAQGLRELSLLKRLRDKSCDKTDEHRVVRLLTQFMYHNHLCLVMGVLSMNLYEAIERTGFRGFSLGLIRNFAKDLLQALSFLSRPNVDVIHCDVKPENIVLQQEPTQPLTRHCDVDKVLSNASVTLVDFGSSCRSNKLITQSYFQSRFYRAPEIMLQLQPYSSAIDMWSLGCVLVEFHTGRPLFAGKNRFEQMETVVSVLGMVPSEMLQKTNACGHDQSWHTQRGHITSTNPFVSLTQIIMAGRSRHQKAHQQHQSKKRKLSAIGPPRVTTTTNHSSLDGNQHQEPPPAPESKDTERLHALH